MKISCRSVKVHRFPDQAGPADSNNLLKVLQREAELERPCFVFDFCNVKSIDERSMCLLLASLEVAMKCNGDLRLANVHTQVQGRLREAGIAGLFEIFPTTDSAARSFQKSANSAAVFMFSEDGVEADMATVA